MTEKEKTDAKNSVLTALKEYWIIFWTMFKIGISTFGGGYAMISIIERELGEKKKWIEGEELLDYIAVSQVTPGIIAVNVSTFVGYKRKGNIGGIIATIAVICPSIIIITIIAAVLANFYDNEYVQHAFGGIRVCVCVLLVNAIISLVRKSIVDILTLIVYIGVFFVAAFTSFSTIYIVLMMIAVSVAVTLIKAKAAGKKNTKKDKEDV